MGSVYWGHLQINYFFWNPHLTVRFWGNLNKTPSHLLVIDIGSKSFSRNPWSWYLWRRSRSCLAGCLILAFTALSLFHLALHWNSLFSALIPFFLWQCIWADYLVIHFTHLVSWHCVLVPCVSYPLLHSKFPPQLHSIWQQKFVFLQFLWVRNMDAA